MEMLAIGAIAVVASVTTSILLTHIFNKHNYKKFLNREGMFYYLEKGDYEKLALLAKTNERTIDGEVAYALKRYIRSYDFAR